MTRGLAEAARAGYSWLLRLGLPLYLLRVLWRGKAEPVYATAIGERIGLHAGSAVRGALWIHAVSLGETRAAAPLIDALRRADPSLRLLLTHGTATGRSAGATLLRSGDTQAWLPFDTPGAVRRFLDRYAPRAGVLMETEIWPNLLHAAQRRGVPMFLANARLSERSRRRGQRVDLLLRPAFASMRIAFAQTPDDAARLHAAGATDVRVQGNLKFDLAPAASLIDRGHQWRQASGSRAVVLAAVTRDGEEARLLGAWNKVAAPRPLLVVVPRHPQRFDAVATLIASAGFTLSRRSGWHDGPPPDAPSADVWLGDSMLEMPAWYALADVALLGGSFAPLGGQNLIEAAACGCPLVVGPHTFNFADAAERAVAIGAAVRVASMDDGVPRAIEIAIGSERKQRTTAALAFAAAHRGAAMRTAAAIMAVLEDDAAASAARSRHQ